MDRIKEEASREEKKKVDEQVFETMTLLLV